MNELTAKIVSWSGGVAGPACRPSPQAVARILENLQILLFPGHFRADDGCAPMDTYISMVLTETLFTLQGQLACLVENGEEISRAFLGEIPRVRQAMELDLQAFLSGDPAAAGEDEIIVSYPGFYAIMIQRLAHILWKMEVPILPRMMTEQAHSATGIDIHPGAVLGKSLFIDHGTGVVIGETTVIGDQVKMYQGVTLGALSTRGGQSLRGKKRHPTLEDGVTVYAGASILGGNTVIGRGATIGANAFVTGSVEPGTVVIGHRPGP